MRHAIGGCLRAVLVAVTAIALSTGGCVPRPREQPLYLNLVWHQHQPLYYRDPDTGSYTRPWVRVHATKDYYDMVAILDHYPKIRLAVNLTPVLIRQLDDLAAGAKDVYWTLAEKPAGELSRFSTVVGIQLPL